MDWLQKLHCHAMEIDYPQRSVIELYKCYAEESYSFIFEYNNAPTKSMPPRYSVIGMSSLAHVALKNNQLTLTLGDTVVQETQYSDEQTAWQQLENSISGISIPAQSELPCFAGGWFGFWGYESIRYFEPGKLPKPELPDLTGSQDVKLLLPERLMVIDHQTRRAWYVMFSTKPITQMSLNYGRGKSWPADEVTGEIKYQFKHSDFLNTVDKLKQHIKDGEIMQAVLSQRMTVPVEGIGLDFFTRLREVSPSPYQFFVRFETSSVFGASPETLIRNQQGSLVSFPMAGTRHRKTCETENKALEAELLQDEKECAEHLMLIDLARNDLGRVAKSATVKVPRVMTVEHFSHVMHITSQVSAELDEQFSNLDLIKATLPAGTLSGAPKIRAMQLIDQYETVRRGFYGGGVGVINDDHLDLAIVIRSAMIKDGQLHVQAGAGVVTDSIPENEWQETMNKSRALLTAIGVFDKQVQKEALPC